MSRHIRKWPCLGCLIPLSIKEEDDHTCPIGWYFSKAGEHRQCKVCKRWPLIAREHNCITRTEGRVDMSKKRWDHTLQCWVLDLPSSKEAKFWDSEKKEWVEEKDFYASSKEAPPADWKKKKDRPDKGTSTTYYNSGSIVSYGNPYQIRYPWEKVDRKKWPTAWWTLFTLYHLHDWHRGHWISNEDWDARLRGEYRPLSKLGKSYFNDNYYSECGEC